MIRCTLTMALMLACSTVLVAAEPVRLFDGKSLKNWKVTNFGGQGEVKVKQGQLLLSFGETLTGVTWEGPPLPKQNYEVQLEAKRVDGTDFFCGLTFPVGEDYLSFILGGWGGGLVGLSCLDGYDASENHTTDYVEFQSDRWYQVRLRVTEKQVAVWLDGKKIVEVDPTRHKLSLRMEVESSRPFGIAAWQTTAALRNITLRRLDAQATAGEQRSP